MTAATRCPGCAARLRDGDAWCGQCHTDLRPPAGPPRHPGPDRAPTGRRARVGPADLAATALLPAAETEAETETETAALADVWARRLAETERGAGLPPLIARTGSAAGRAALALGAGAVIVAVLLLVMAVAGLVL